METTIYYSALRSFPLRAESTWALLTFRDATGVVKVSLKLLELWGGSIEGWLGSP